MGEVRVPDSRYYALLVVDIENWGGRPAVVQVRLQAALRGILRDAIAVSSVSAHDVRTTSRGDGAIVAIPAVVPKEVVTARLVRAIDEKVRGYDVSADAGAEMRLRVALHAGDIHDGGDEWAGEAVVTACRLVDSELLHRVLAAAGRSVLALIVSDVWYRSVVGGGWVPPAGFERVWPVVKNYDGPAWVRVPAYDDPPGLRPVDRSVPAGAAAASSGGAATGDVVQGQRIAVRGDFVLGDKIHGDRVSGDKFIINNGRAAR